MQTGILEREAQQTDQQWIQECALRWLGKDRVITWNYDLVNHLVYGFSVFNLTSQKCVATVSLSDRVL